MNSFEGVNNTVTQILLDIAFASDNHLFLVAIASDCFCDAPGILLTLANVEAKMGKASMDTRELTPGKA